MPNNITNILDVTGPAKAVEAFKAKVYKVIKGQKNPKDNGPVFDFNATVPIPKELLDTTSPPQSDAERKLQAAYTKKYGAGNWYGNAYSTCPVKKIEGGLRFRFDTAWSPPDNWLETTAKMYPSLKLVDSWIDEGGGAGQYTYEGEETSNEVLEDHDWRMDFDEDYQAEYLFITEGNYKKLVKTYSEKEEPDYYSLNENLLNRLEKKDLPLFLNYDWGNVEDAFQRKLKGE